MAPETQRHRILIAFLCIYFVWGTTFFGIAVGLRTLPPFVLAAARFLLAGAVLYAWLRWRDPHPFAGLPAGRVIVAGLLYSFLGNGMLTWAQQGVPSGIAAMINSSVPICVALIDWAAFSRRRPAARTVAGILVATAGVALIVSQTKSFHGSVGLLYLGALLVSVTAWSTASLLQRDVVKPERLLAFSAGQMLVGAAAHVVASFLSGEWREVDVAALDPSSFASVAYLALFGTVLGQTAYFFLVSRVATHYVTTYALVNPVVALFLGVLLLNEVLTIGVALGCLLVLSGVAFVLFHKQGSRLFGWVGRALTRQP